MFIIQMERQLEGPVGHTASAAQEVQHLIEHLVKVYHYPSTSLRADITLPARELYGPLHADTIYTLRQVNGRDVSDKRGVR